MGSNLEKCGKFWKNGRFSGRIRPDWGNTARADMAGLGSIGLRLQNIPVVDVIAMGVVVFVVVPLVWTERFYRVL